MNYSRPDKIPAIWEVGDVILDLYEVKQVFTGGGMGLVYRVYHRNWNIDLAVKSPRPEYFQTLDQIENFEREAETWVNLGLHPHIVSCYYVRRLGGIPRIFAEFVEGGTLSDWIRSRRLYEGTEEAVLTRVLDIAIQFAWGLHYAHEKGLVHQDVKPANVLMTLDGTAKVSDFGLANARKFGSETTQAHRPGQSMSVPGSGFMTPEYASPEQARGGHLSKKTDIWSWAVSVLEMMKGELDWSYGQAAFHVLLDFYGDRYDLDPVAKVLGRCLTEPMAARPSSIIDEAAALIRVMEAHSGVIFPRTYPDEEHVSSDVLNNKGVSLLDIGRQDEGIQAFEEALTLNPRNIHAKFNVLVTGWRIGRYSDDHVTRELYSVRDQSNREDIDSLIKHVLKESGAGERKEAHIHSLETDSRHSLINLGRHNTRVIFCALRVFNSQAHILSVSQDGTLMVHTSTGQLVQTWTIPFSIKECIVSPHWEKIIFSDDTGPTLEQRQDPEVKRGAYHKLGKSYLRVFDLKKGAITQTLFAHYGCVNLHDIKSDNRFLTTGGYDGTVRLWQMDNSQPICYLELDSFEVRNQSDSTTRDNKTYNIYKALCIPHTGVLAIREQKQIRLLEQHAAKLQQSPKKPKGLLSMIGFTNASDKLEQWLTSHVLRPSSEEFVNDFTFSHDGRLVAMGNCNIDLFSCDYTFIRTWSTSARCITGLHFSKNAQFLIGRGFDVDEVSEALIIWDVATGRRLRTIRFVSEPLHTFEWDEKSGNICVGGREGTIWFGQLTLPKSNNFLSLSRPTSFDELKYKSVARIGSLNAARGAFDAGLYQEALDKIRELQLNEDYLRDPELQRLEKRVASRGRRLNVTNAKLEVNLNPGDGPPGTFYINSTGTQSLWLETYSKSPQGDQIPLKRGGILFDVESGAIIKKGLSLSEDLLENNLFQAGGREMWNVYSSTRCLVMDYREDLQQSYSFVLPIFVWSDASKWEKSNMNHYIPRLRSISLCKNYILMGTPEGMVVYNLRSGQKTSEFKWSYWRGSNSGFDERYSKIDSAILGEGAKWVVLKVITQRPLEWCDQKIVKLSCETWIVEQEFATFHNPNYDTYPIRHISLCDNGAKLFARTIDGAIIWSVETGQTVYNFISEDTVTDFIDCDPYLAVDYEKLPMKLVNLKTGSEFSVDWKASTIGGENIRINNVLLDNGYVCVAFTNGAIGIFDKAGNKQEIVLRVGNSNRVARMKLSDDKLRLIAETSSLNWDAAKGWNPNVWIFHLFWDYDFGDSGRSTEE